jgi:outer membrane autotransporter protein
VQQPKKPVVNNNETPKQAEVKITSKHDEVKAGSEPLDKQKPVQELVEFFEGKVERSYDSNNQRTISTNNTTQLLNTQISNSAQEQAYKITESFNHVSLVTHAYFSNLENIQKDLEDKTVKAKTSGSALEIQQLAQKQEVLKAIEIIYQAASQEVLKHVSQTTSTVLLNQIAESLSNTVSTPIMQMNGMRMSPVGIASGSGIEQFGLWAQGFLGFAEQKKNDANNAYRSSGMGLSVGFDIGNEDGVVGVSGSFAKSNLLFTELGDLENITNSGLISAYSSYFFTPQIQVTGQIGAGISNIELQDKSKRVGKLFFGNFEGKYYFSISEKFSIVPKAGFEMFKSCYGDDSNSDKKKSNSTSSPNVDSSRGSGFAGVGVKTDIISNDFVISPEFAIGAEVMLFGDEKKMLNNLPTPTKAAGKALNQKTDGGDDKLTFFVDGSVNIAKSSLFRGTIGANYSMRKDFYSIGGFMKISVNM